ncbi:MAG: hypothetical protein HQ461_04685, partial [Deltaproteobacteria bacterium]|nr:hypothetical protein [Deltaproteobacteria bacterium]
MSCNSSYHVESSACMADTRTCSAPDATDATESWTGAEYGTCTVSACLPTHHVDAGVC